MARFDFKKKLMGGEFLTDPGILQQWKFVLYIFVLIILYISINFEMENSLVKERKNQAELKQLNSEYTSKSAKLLYKSKRVEIEKMLMEHNSKLKIPTEPPKVLKTN